MDLSPFALSASLLLNGTAQDWGTPRGGFNAGDNVVISETTSVTSISLCTITGSRVTKTNGTVANLPLPYTATLASRV